MGLEVTWIKVSEWTWKNRVYMCVNVAPALSLSLFISLSLSRHTVYKTKRQPCTQATLIQEQLCPPLLIVGRLDFASKNNTFLAFFWLFFRFFLICQKKDSFLFTKTSQNKSWFSRPVIQKTKKTRFFNKTIHRGVYKLDCSLTSAPSLLVLAFI